jgi:hypothetical protein
MLKVGAGWELEAVFGDACSPLFDLSAEPEFCERAGDGQGEIDQDSGNSALFFRGGGRPPTKQEAGGNSGADRAQ